MKRIYSVGAAVGLLGVVLTACGSGGSAASSVPGSGEVQVAMVDIAFEPDVVEVPVGTEVTFSFANDGKLEHEALIGTAEEQEDHEVEMQDAMSDSEMANAGGDGHDEGGDGHDEGAEALSLEPGDSGVLTHTFDEPGEYLIGCHVPGHWDAGMRMTVIVT